MNLAHLRKQAKNLKQLYPELVAAQGGTFSLAQAQEAVARIHGYPSWSAAVAKADPVEGNRLREATTPDLGAVIRGGYSFEMGEAAELAVDLDDNGEPTRYAAGREAVLSLRRRSDTANVRKRPPTTPSAARLGIHAP